MATSRSSSAAARLSRAAAAALRASATGNQSTRSDLAAAIARPRALIAANESKIWNPNSFSLNRFASSPALARSYSTSAASAQIPGAKGIPSQKEKSTLAAMLINLPNRTLWHIYEGVEEIMADYVHQEMTRTWILVCFRLFLLIIMKDAFLSFTNL